MADTFSTADAALATTLARALGRLNVVQAENVPLVSSDLLTYYAPDQNWLAAPPAVTRVNGTIQSPTVDRTGGSVTFASALLDTDVVSCSYTFQPYVTADLTDMLTDALYAVEGLLGTAFDETAVPRKVKEAVVTRAFLTAVRGLSTRTADYYRWEVDGRMVDKSKVTAQYDLILARSEKLLADQLAWLRPQFLAEGESITLNIDEGRAPNRYSLYRPPGWGPQ